MVWAGAHFWCALGEARPSAKTVRAGSQVTMGVGQCPPVSRVGEVAPLGVRMNLFHSVFIFVEDTKGSIGYGELDPTLSRYMRLRVHMSPNNRVARAHRNAPISDLSIQTYVSAQRSSVPRV